MKLKLILAWAIAPAMAVPAVAQEVDVEAIRSHAQVVLDLAERPAAEFVIPCTPASDLQAVLDAAVAANVAKTVIELELGDYSTKLVLRARSNPNGPIVIRTRGTFPAGRATREADASRFATLHSTDHLSVIVTEPRASDYIFRNVAFGPNTTAVNDIIVLGSRTITSAADLPTRITFERVLVLGHPSSGTRRGFAGHARHLVVKNSAVYDMKLVATDAQAFWAANTPGPISLINNYFEAAGEVVLFGGAAVGINGVVPSDILVERNTITRPVAWRTVTPAWTVKNLLELKNARRVTVRNNEFSHNWAQAQVGWGVVLQPRPQDGVTWYVVEDVVFERNVFRSMGGVFNMSGEDPAHPEDGNRLRRITIRNNLALDISTTNWGGTGRFAQMIGYPETAPPLDGSGPLNGPVDVTIEDNIIEHQYQAVFFSGQKGSGLRFSRNLLRRNSGVFVGGGTASGIPTLNRYQNVAGVPAWTVVDNAIYGGSTDTPPGNTNYLLAEWDAALAAARAAWGAP